MGRVPGICFLPRGTPTAVLVFHVLGAIDTTQLASIDRLEIRVLKPRDGEVVSAFAYYRRQHEGSGGMA